MPIRGIRPTTRNGRNSMATPVLVTGASGFVGSRLIPALLEQGHHVRAMTRHPDSYDGVGEPTYGDVGDTDSLRAALDGMHAAYYLVHSLDSDDFEQRDAEELLGLGGVPVTVLRAAVVVGHGGISWEITRQLVDHLPAMVTPRWVYTRTQPIALPDVIRYLVGVLDGPETRGRVFEIGGPEVLRYIDMLKRAAMVQGKRLPSVGVP